VDFDPARESVSVLKVWEIFLGLPLAFWTREALETIGNKLGNFVGLEPNWATKLDRHWAWIQIEVNAWEGLVGSLDIVYGDITWHQKVDYWKIPFRCHGCHEIGHLKSRCLKPAPWEQPPQKIWRRKSTMGWEQPVETLSFDEKHEGVELELGSEKSSSLALGPCSSGGQFRYATSKSCSFSLFGYVFSSWGFDGTVSPLLLLFPQ
jgi:hypothetical protein